ncbi:uncharacterized protein E0L32_008745 [Thyridium curvatum]|uniref:Uncharacterized protein n=1 Tax=Thyridium curvatum TaxID=1093900 RepID=A0A507B1B1_9PEZI|nr:uncharacterized protein E0L32_008745 [Thyridium curvatum]TPX10340.1 hypothetical protein E0L32_008745 [Thyridium curvatum]
MAPSTLFQYLGFGARKDEPSEAPGQATTCQSIVRVGATGFLLGPKSQATIPIIDGPERYVPATVVHKQEGKFGDEELEEVVDDFERRDDVWNTDFLEVIVLAAPSSVKSNNEFKRGSKVIRPNHSLEVDDVPSGPYILHSSSGSIYKVFKLFPDESQAFVGAIAPSARPGDAFSWLDSINHVAVPSRLYHPGPTKERPLEGTRFAVKDVIDVRGLHTSCGSASWRSTYPPVQQSAPFVDQLLAAGASLVGKLRCCQFGDNQSPSERFEEVSPTNPRGDRFQIPGSTSSGSAAAIASYSWLDFTIGTENSDSRQHAAGLNGVYALRPSKDSVKSKGVFTSPLLESTNIFSRSASLAEDVANCVTGKLNTAGKGKLGNFQFKLLYAVESRGWSAIDSDPDFFLQDISANDRLGDASALFDTFIKKLEKQLDCKRQTLCLSDFWRDTRAANTPQALTASAVNASRAIIYRDLSRNIVEPFINEYRAAHANRMPFIEPVTKERLRFGACVSDDEYSTAKDHLEVYAEWVNTVLLPSPADPVDAGPADGKAAAGKQGPEIPILVCPQHWGTRLYRDASRSTLARSGLSASSIAASAGVPHLILPVGEIKYTSKITEADARLPVSMSLLAPSGLDGILTEIIANLERAGEIEVVKPGPSVF